MSAEVTIRCDYCEDVTAGSYGWPTIEECRRDVQAIEPPDQWHRIGRKDCCPGCWQSAPQAQADYWRLRDRRESARLRREHGRVTD